METSERAMSVSSTTRAVRRHEEEKAIDVSTGSLDGGRLTEQACYTS